MAYLFTTIYEIFACILTMFQKSAGLLSSAFGDSLVFGFLHATLRLKWGIKWNKQTLYIYEL